MIYQVIAPCEALRQVISHFWVGSWDTSSRMPGTTYYIIAGSMTELTFAFNHRELSFSLVQGHTHRPRQFTVDKFNLLIGVSLYSHAIPVLFGMPASELNNAFMSPETFLGNEGSILSEKMAEAIDTPRRIRILSDYFISLLYRQQPEDKAMLHAIHTIKNHGGRISIEDLAGDCYLSYKQFFRRFKAYSGFTPKTYTRIIRLESMIRNYSEALNLTQTAYLNDYYDQAHFTHEFKSLTGFTPKDFRKMGRDQQ